MGLLRRMRTLNLCLFIPLLSGRFVRFKRQAVQADEFADCRACAAGETCHTIEDQNGLGNDLSPECVDTSTLECVNCASDEYCNEIHVTPLRSTWIVDCRPIPPVPTTTSTTTTY